MRQLLHVTFGSVLRWRDEEGVQPFRGRLLKALNDHEEHYYQLLKEHFKRYFDLLE